MEKPPYNHAALVKAKESIQANIERIQKALNDEYARLAEFDLWIKQHEEYRKQQIEDLKSEK